MHLFTTFPHATVYKVENEEEKDLMGHLMQEGFVLLDAYARYVIYHTAELDRATGYLEILSEGILRELPPAKAGGVTS